jgi:plasmid stabilization system protein ParE
MNAQHPVQTLAQRRAIAAYTAAQRGVDAAREAQTELERLLAAKRAGEEARAARYAASREYAMRCVERDALVRRSSDVPPAAPTWLAWTAMVALSIVLTTAAWSFAEYLLPMLWRLK